MFPARFYKQDENDPVLNEIHLYRNLHNTRHLRESDIDITDVRSQLEHQI